MALDTDEPFWKNLRLSLERPYKDDSGNPIPVVFDLTPQGESVYEPKGLPSERLASNLSKIFVERGLDVFEKRDDPSRTDDGPDISTEDDTVEEKDAAPKPMTVDELHAMRMEIMPHLFVALGEMSQAKDLLTSILSSALGGQIPPSQTQGASDSTALSAMTVTKPPPIVSVQAFNAQLSIGGKDEALRKASQLFGTAAESMSRSRVRGEKYWVNALTARRANWGLSPAPLPFGSAMGKGADKTSKDFIISYGLEGSPPGFRRRAIAQMPTVGDASQQLVFPFHQNTRLRTSLSFASGSKTETSAFTAPSCVGDMDLDATLRNAQIEIANQEIFSFLVAEAGNLPTASVQVAERLIIINAAQGLDLTFELIDNSSITQSSTVNSDNGDNLSELIYHVLHVLLLRKHSTQAKKVPSSKSQDRMPSILQPIIDVLQYQVFCQRILSELRRAVNALNDACIPSTLSFTAVGESGERIVSLLSGEGDKSVGGEAIIRIDNRHTIRFTMVSPSTLTAHLPQATLSISSLPQLTQLLMDEIDRCLLQKICIIGREIRHDVNGIWFVDLDRCIARWEGVVLNFQISFDKDFQIGCSAVRLDNSAKEGDMSSYVSSEKRPFFEWLKEMILNLA